MEALTPVLLFLRGRALALGVLLSFHLMTYLTIGIHFLPTILCLLAFVPLERAWPCRRTSPERAPRLRPTTSGRSLPT
jgi:hypothetical protein